MSAFALNAINIFTPKPNHQFQIYHYGQHKISKSFRNMCKNFHKRSVFNNNIQRSVFNNNKKKNAINFKKSSLLFLKKLMDNSQNGLSSSTLSKDLLILYAVFYLTLLCCGIHVKLIIKL